MSYKAAVITVSDGCSRGERTDTSGPSLCRIIEEMGYEVTHIAIVPDERELISEELIRCCDDLQVNLILTTGGTGFAKRDVTPEATMDVIERETRGIPEAMRAVSMQITPRGCLSRGVAGIRGCSLIINLPGSEKGARENFNAVKGAIDHALKMIESDGSANCAGN